MQVLVTKIFPEKEIFKTRSFSEICEKNSVNFIVSLIFPLTFTARASQPQFL